MSSKAWFKSAAPRLIRKFVGETSTGSASDANSVVAAQNACNNTWKRKRRSVEIWTTTCIVTNFGRMQEAQRVDLGRQKGGQQQRQQRQQRILDSTSRNSRSNDGDDGRFRGPNCSILINPANPDLSGPHKFPYFPKGGPEPKQQPQKDAHHIMGYVTQWGGMEVGGGMMFSAAVVDGMVHQLGGMRLRAECKLKSALAMGNDACPVGTSVVTSPGGPELRAEYDSIVHTVPPFYAHHPSGNVDELLRSCYRTSFELAFGTGIANNQRVAVPLLGAGCRGFPLDTAIQIAAEESVRWLDTTAVSSVDVNDEQEEEEVVAFGLLEDTVASKLVTTIEESSVSKQ